jgi:ubiquinone/menaquinone biosynthesis C-methylase UbiE
MLNNYDNIARQYDFLSRLVFGKSQVRAQVELLRFIECDDRILIVGGGTGWILEELAARYPAGLRITYVEISARMIALSRQRNCGQNEVNFINLPVEEFSSEERYDRILTGFLFDNFSTERSARVFSQLDAVLKRGGDWLYTDFYFDEKEGVLWQMFLLKTMYIFFGWLCKVESRELVDTGPLFKAAGYREISLSSKYRGFIRSFVYKKGP